ncbi:hypothetical protein B0181_11760 [Moraxella caviae]|uniref:Uncharacterized protein n=1 Tax=Moraxella caviae TaxID=34060 RepID=A0A1S9ZRR0_9GAMM|nr:hypothetical protein B0181_11760 [Moraxella caviae]
MNFLPKPKAQTKKSKKISSDFTNRCLAVHCKSKKKFLQAQNAKNCVIFAKIAVFIPLRPKNHTFWRTNHRKCFYFISSLAKISKYFYIILCNYHKKSLNLATKGTFTPTNHHKIHTPIQPNSQITAFLNQKQKGLY